MSARARAALLALLASASCSEPAAPTAPQPGSFASRFSEQRAWSHLEALVALGPRGPGLPGHSAAQTYLRERLAEAGATLEDVRVEYRGAGDTQPRTFTNVVGRFGPREGRWLLLGTHYDTRLLADLDPDPAKRSQPIPGANDGGSGVAVLLEVARVLGETPPPFGVEIVFFDGEDYGHQSSADYLVGSRGMVQQWSRLRPGGWPAAVVVVDMVGDADLEIHPEATSHPALVARLWGAAERLGERVFARTPGVGIIDDHSPFLRAGVPAALLIDLDYAPYHTTDDVLAHCAPASLGSAGRVLLAAFFDEPW